VSSQGPVALVIGGSGDIGRAVASKLGKLGYRVAIAGLTGPHVDEAVRALQERGGDARGFVCDLTDEDAIVRLFEGVDGAYGRLDVLVNAAGIAEPRLLARADQRHLERTLRANLIGPALAARHALARMRKVGGGTIVNVASTAAREGRKGFGVYGASKGALLSLSASLRQEAARFGVRVSSVCPGRVDTRMHGEDPERPTMIRPDDVAEAVAFLLRLSPHAEVRELWVHNRTREASQPDN
jgi:NAD(P)-dependent dehydrogenase (short-subunit alcohol dehydrogenase family)